MAVQGRYKTVKKLTYFFAVVSLQGLDATALSNLLPEQLLVDVLAERFQVSEAPFFPLMTVCVTLL